MIRKIVFAIKINGFKQTLLAGLVVCLLAACQTQPKWAVYEGIPGRLYPGELWQKAQTPEQIGWSSEKLAEARAYSKQIGSAAVMIVDGGVVVDSWGDITRRFQCHSMRKSLMSALIGVHVDQGDIDLSKTMGDLGIDRMEPSLTAE
jgi:CubicO group peptidase (beta-lactamase class C family)